MAGEGGPFHEHVPEVLWEASRSAEVALAVRDADAAVAAAFFSGTRPECTGFLHGADAGAIPQPGGHPAVGILPRRHQVPRETILSRSAACRGGVREAAPDSGQKRRRASESRPAGGVEQSYPDAFPDPECAAVGCRGG